MNYGSGQGFIITGRYIFECKGMKRPDGGALSLGYAFTALINLVPRYHE